MRLPHGPGYRIYYKQTGRMIVVILCGGDKSTQESDIKRAKQIAKQL
jgi:putative addiction module killer protein